MTITPTPLVPTPPAGTASAAAGAGKGEQLAAAAGFGALLAELAAAALPTGKAAGQPGTPAGSANVAGTKLVEGEGSEESAPAGDLLLTPSTDPAVAVPLDPVVAPAVGQPGPVVASDGGEASLAETAVRGVALPTTAPTQPGAPDVGTVGVTGALPTQPTADAPIGAEAQPMATVSTAVNETEAAPQASSSTQPSAVAGATSPPSPVVAAGPAGATNAAPGVAPSPLLDQVTPVVSRMVSAGEGSHRMVLRLHPADLGEVQLTVTVRGESVDVTVAAGTEARGMLAGGSSELRALLDSIGRTAGQITFRELPGAGQLQQPSLGFAAGGQPDAGQGGTSYGDVAGGRDGEGDGRGGSDRTGPKALHDPRTESDTPTGTTTSGTPGNGALDVRI